MAIEINQKRSSNFPLWAVISFFILAVLIIGVIVTYLYFYIVTKGIIGKITELDESSLELNKNIIAKESELLLAQKRIDDFKNLVLSHKDLINIFSFLEKKVMPNINFTSFDFNRSDENLIILKGASLNLMAIGQQIDIFQNDNLVKKVSLAGMEITDKGGIGFTLKVSFKPEIFSFNDKTDE